MALNNTKVMFNGLSVGNGVYHGVKDQTSEIHFDERFCSTCRILQERPGK